MLRVRKGILIGFLTFGCILYYIVPSKRIAKKEKPEQRMVLIFGATTIFGQPMYPEDIIQKTCPRNISSYCTFTTRREKRREADAWIYHNADYKRQYRKEYNASKIHIWYSQESPTVERLTVTDDIINWTMGYRRDADFFVPYGYFSQLSEVVADNTSIDHIWNKKNTSLTAAWLVSNCKALSRRDKTVEGLRKAGLKVDIYGNCFSGTQIPKCKRFSKDRWTCPTKTLEKYYFYFSLEKVNCVDYVSEKFFNTLDYYQTVPIVIKRKIYEDLKFPTKTYIAVNDFDSYKHMVHFLNKLKANKEEYMSYHSWRKSYRIDYPFQVICQICERLRYRNLEKPKKNPKLSDWYDSMKNCDNDYVNKFH